MLLDLRFVGNAKCSGAGLRFPGFIRSRFDRMNTSWTRCLRFVRQWVLTFYRRFPEPRSNEADEKAALRRLERVSYAAGVAAVGFGCRGDFTFPSRRSAPQNLQAAGGQAGNLLKTGVKRSGCWRKMGPEFHAMNDALMAEKTR